MTPVDRHKINLIYSALLTIIVFLSWGFVIYASTVATQWMLEENYPDLMSRSQAEGMF